MGSGFHGTAAGPERRGKARSPIKPKVNLQIKTLKRNLKIYTENPLKCETASVSKYSLHRFIVMFDDDDSDFLKFLYKLHHGLQKVGWTAPASRAAVSG